ncbi:MAG: serine--tRNA ligase [Myxococcota bacterium]
MLDIRSAGDSLESIRKGLRRRGFQDDEALETLEVLSGQRKHAIAAVESKQAALNEASAAMSALDKASEAFAEKRNELRVLGDEIRSLNAERDRVEQELENRVLLLPNLPVEDAPDGFDESANVVQRTYGTKPQFDFPVRDHVELGIAMQALEFERAVKVSGARFVILRHHGARLSRALLSFMMDVHADEHGYIEIWPPALVKASAMIGTGQLPKFAEDAFRVAEETGAHSSEATPADPLYLIPTGEVPVTNLHADEIIAESDLPMAYCAYTPCFRREAGSHGKDTRGMIRLHQFDKVELVRFCKPEDGREQLELLTSHAEEVLKRLELHYRVVELCAGDMGFAAQKSFDLEVWLPSQERYREISSCSWFGDFQSRRMRTRYRPNPSGNKKSKPQLLHTLNGSGLAIGRTAVAIVEQYQQKDGSVRVPEVLVPYMGGVGKLA